MNLKKFNKTFVLWAWALMLLSLFASSMSRLCYRLVALQSLSGQPEQLLGAQSLIGTCVVGMVLLIRKQPLLPTQGRCLQALRALIAVIAYHFLLISLAHYPLYVGTLIGLSTVFLTTLGSIVFFEKRPPPKAVLWGCFLGLCGGALSLKSVSYIGKEGIFIAPVMASILFSASSLILKKTLSLQKENQPLQHLFSLLLMMSIILIPSYHSTEEWAHILILPESWALASLYLISQGCYIASYQQADLSLISPVKFFKIPLAAFWDYTVFHRPLTLADLLAATLVFLGALVSKPRSEHYCSYKKKPPAPLELRPTHTTGLS